MEGKKNDSFKGNLYPDFCRYFYVRFCAFSRENQKFTYLLNKGLVVIETYPEKAQKLSKRIIELSNEGFYDGLTFHRVISDFIWLKVVIQTEMVQEVMVRT